MKMAHNAADRAAWSALYAGAAPAAGSLVETYLEARGIPLDRVWGVDRGGEIWERVPPVLRFAPAVWHAETETRWPAMLAPLQNPLGVMAGIHITYLAADGSGKAPVAPAKRMRGQVGGNAIRLSALIDPGVFDLSGVPISLTAWRCLASTLGLAEGIETALSVMAMRGTCYPALWVPGSLGNIAGAGLGKGPRSPDKPGVRLPSPVPDLARPGFVPPRPAVVNVWLFEDADGDRLTAGALQDRAAVRFHAMGFRVRRYRAGAGLDFNDMLTGANHNEGDEDENTWRRGGTNGDRGGQKSRAAGGRGKGALRGQGAYADIVAARGRRRAINGNH